MAFFNSAIEVLPVSYTHLDVYKRQPTRTRGGAKGTAARDRRPQRGETFRSLGEKGREKRKKSSLRREFNTVGQKQSNSVSVIVKERRRPRRPGPSRFCSLAARRAWVRIRVLRRCF